MTFHSLQLERRRRREPLPTFPEIRDLVREVGGRTASPATIQRGRYTLVKSGKVLWQPGNSVGNPLQPFLELSF
jgi:hypothetical protein